MAALSLLADLLARPGGAQRAGLEPGQTWDRLARRRGAWARALAGERSVALALPDGFEFAAALLGAWSAGAGVVLPGDATERTLEALKPLAARIFMGDASAPPDSPSPGSFPARTMPAVPVTVFTSGSTGQPAAIPKPLRCLDVELAALETAFGPGVEGASFLSTVSHQHYYGLLFKVLWPLAAGRPFLARQLFLPEDLAAAAAGLARCAVVSSPAMLKRLGGSPQALQALEPVRESAVAVFSSGGPLPWDAVHRSVAALGRTPTEVYGSSETGGVAWRRRERESDPWAPLPGVEVAVGLDQALSLRSAHGPSLDWERSDDLAAKVDGGFQLLGRADRIAKVEEKRVSLAALEARLAGHPEVAEARVLVLKGAREVLGAVVRLRSGALPAAGRRRELTLELRGHLADGAEAVALPRRWRYVEALPADSMGKTSLAALEELFAEPETTEPELLFERPLGVGVELDLLLPASLRWFRGHFPGHALLPGVVQLHWAIEAGRRRLGLRGAFKGLRALKFMRPLRPDQRVTLTLALAPGGFDFTYATEAGKHASGRVLIG